jgi:aquaporin Z
VSNTSVNPARSIGAAVVAGGEALTQLWVFLLAPSLGGILAAAVWRLLSDERVVTPAPAAGPHPAVS